MRFLLNPAGFQFEYCSYGRPAFTPRMTRRLFFILHHPSVDNVYRVPSQPTDGRTQATQSSSNPNCEAAFRDEQKLACFLPGPDPFLPLSSPSELYTSPHTFVWMGRLKKMMKDNKNQLHLFISLISASAHVNISTSFRCLRRKIRFRHSRTSGQLGQHRVRLQRSLGLFLHFNRFGEGWFPGRRRVRPSQSRGDLVRTIRRLRSLRLGTDQSGQRGRHRQRQRDWRKRWVQNYVSIHVKKPLYVITETFLISKMSCSRKCHDQSMSPLAAPSRRV